MTTCIAKIQEIKSPIKGIFRGYRINIATPNMAGNFFGSPRPSFKKPYFICCFGDYEDEAALDKGIVLAKKELHSRGFEVNL